MSGLILIAGVIGAEWLRRGVGVGFYVAGSNVVGFRSNLIVVNQNANGRILT